MSRPFIEEWKPDQLRTSGREFVDSMSGYSARKPNRKHNYVELPNHFPFCLKAAQKNCFMSKGNSICLTCETFQMAYLSVHRVGQRGSSRNCDRTVFIQLYCILFLPDLCITKNLIQSGTLRTWPQQKMTDSITAACNELLLDYGNVAYCIGRFPVQDDSGTAMQEAMKNLFDLKQNRRSYDALFEEADDIAQDLPPKIESEIAARVKEYWTITLSQRLQEESLDRMGYWIRHCQEHKQSYVDIRKSMQKLRRNSRRTLKT